MTDFFTKEVSWHDNTCVDCSCKKIEPGRDACAKLQELNNTGVKGGSQVLADAEVCDYPKVFPKITYSIWCVLKNVIAQLCWLMNQIDDIPNMKKKINEMIDKINAMCRALECVVDSLHETAKVAAQAQANTAVGDLIKNVSFAMRGQGSAEATNDGSVTATNIQTDNSGNFSITWNMVVIGVGEFARGTIRGKVNHAYTGNQDGSIETNIISYTLNRVDYEVTKQGGLATPASFSVIDNRGQTVWKKDYTPTQPFNETINKTVQLNLSRKLALNGGTTGNVFLFETLDDWDTADTRGSVFAVYTNNNKVIPKPPVTPPRVCDFECGTNIQKL